MSYASALSQPRTHRAQTLAITVITRHQYLGLIHVLAACFLLISSSPLWNKHRPSVATNGNGVWLSRTSWNFQNHHHHQMAYRNDTNTRKTHTNKYMEVPIFESFNWNTSWGQMSYLESWPRTTPELTLEDGCLSVWTMMELLLKKIYLLAFPSSFCHNESVACKVLFKVYV